MRTERRRARTGALAGLVLAAGAAQAELTAYVGATVHPVSGPAIEEGTVLVRDGRIEAVGQGLEIPGDARSVELDGLHVYPGFVHPGTALGLTEINSVPGTVDTAEMGQVNAALSAEVAFNHDSMLLPASIAGGVVAAHIAPVGGLIRGTSAVMNLDGWSWEEMILAAPAGMHIDFPLAAADDEESEDLAKIEAALDAARHYLKARRAAADNAAPAPPRNDQLEALVPLLEGEIPLFIHASRADAMEAALDWAGEQAFENLVLVATADARYLAERLAAEDIPVILKGVYSMPTRRWEAYDMAFTAPARLHEAGVRFAISDSGGGLEVANARNLPFQAGSAIAHGLDPAAALKAVTLWPAEILGVGAELGSLEPGKRASFFAATGDPLEPMSSIERVWIDGEEYDLSRDRQRRLYERYRERNAQTAAAQ